MNTPLIEYYVRNQQAFQTAKSGLPSDIVTAVEAEIARVQAEKSVRDETANTISAMRGHQDLLLAGRGRVEHLTNSPFAPADLEQSIPGWVWSLGTDSEALARQLALSSGENAQLQQKITSCKTALKDLVDALGDIQQKGSKLNIQAGDRVDQALDKLEALLK